MKQVRVKNLDEGWQEYKYVIIRTDTARTDFYWYYGASNDLLRCSKICQEIRNGLVVESERVEPMDMCD